MRKIKICHFANHLTGKADGVFTHILSIINNSDKNKFEFSLCFQGGDYLEEKIKKCNMKYFIIRELPLRYNYLSIIKFIKICVKEKFDIIHCHHFKTYIISALLKPLFHYKVIYNYHGEFIKTNYTSKSHQFINKVLNLIAVNLVDKVIVPSNKSKELLLLEESKFTAIEVYYNSPLTNVNDKTSFTKEYKFLFELKNSKKFVGIIARQHPQKRIDIALHILKELIQDFPNIHFVFCGDGYLLDEMKSLSKKLGVWEHLTFMGFVENITELMQFIEVMLLTSDYEGFPFAVWEAMASGVPIVSTDVGGISEILIKENCGITFEKGNITEGVMSLKRILLNDKLRIEMGKNGREAINKKYNLKSFINKIEDIYLNVLN